MADFSLSAEITGNSKGFTTAINSCLSSLDDLRENIGKATTKISDGCKSWGLDLDKFYNKGSGILKDFGVDLEKFASHFGVNGKIIAGVVAVSSATLKFGESVNEARANIAKGTGAIGKDLDDLTNTFQDVLLSGVGRSMDEISNMMADINTRFGATGDELKTLVGDFDQFADITGTDVKTSINGVADVMRKWGLSAEEINPLMQQLSMTAKMSGASVTDLMNSMKQGQSVFSQFGMSGTQSLAFLGTLAQNGIDSATALQGLKTALVKFSAEGKNAQDGLKEISDKIKNATSEEEALNLAISTFGNKSGVEMLRVLKDGSLNADDFANALRNAGGSMEETYNVSRNLSSALDDFKSTISSLFVNFGSGFSDLFRDVVDSVRLVVSNIIPYFTPILNAFGDVFSFVGKMIKQLFEFFEEFKQRFGSQMNGVVDTLVNLRDNFKGILDNIFKNFQSVFNVVFAILDGKWRLAWLNVKVIMQRSADSVLKILSSIVNAFKNSINNIIGMINNAIRVYNNLPSVAKIFGNLNELNLIQNVDLSAMTGLTRAISETEKEIEILSGKASQKVIGDIGAIRDNVVKTATVQQTEALKTFEIESSYEDKLLQQKIKSLQESQNLALKEAENRNASAKEQYDIYVSYQNQIDDIQKRILEKRKQDEIKKLKETTSAKIKENNLVGAELEKVTRATDEEILKIETYYNNEISNIRLKSLKDFEKGNKNSVQNAESWWDKFKNRMKENAESWDDVFDSMESAVTNFVSNGLEKVGESLVSGKASWESYGQMALQMVAEILEALGKQLTAMAVTKALMGDFAGAALATAGATAAFVGAGALKGLANAMDTVKKSTNGAVQSLADFRKILSDTISSSKDVGSFVSGYATISTQVKAVEKDVKNASETFKKKQNDYLSLLKSQGKWSKQAEQGELDTTKWTYTEWVTSGNHDKQVTRFYTDLNNAMGDYNTVLKNLNTQQQKYREAQEALNKIQQETVANLETESEALKVNADFFKMFYTDAISSSDSYIVSLQNEIAILQELNSVYEDLAKAGSEIGKNLVDNIINGATKEDFFTEMRDYLRENIIKLTVYNEEFTRRMAGLGEMMSEAIVQGANEGDALFDVLKLEFDELYDDVSEKTKNIDNMLNQFFKKTEEDSEEWAESVEDNLTTFEQNMKSFKDSLKDLGGSIGNEFVNALSNGMNLNDFMESFKKFIKNMLVQTVVYTDSMKGKIEAIGKKISDALKSGTYSEDLFSDMKRELSLTFDEAFLQTSIIDDLLNKGFDLNAFATGTNNAERGLAIVGEQGAELIDFKGGERVYNARDTQAILSGAGATSNNFNVTFNNVQDTSAFTMMNQLRRYNREMAIAGVF